MSLIKPDFFVGNYINYYGKSRYCVIDFTARSISFFVVLQRAAIHIAEKAGLDYAKKLTYSLPKDLISQDKYSDKVNFFSSECLLEFNSQESRGSSKIFELSDLEIKIIDQQISNAVQENARKY